MGPGARLGWNSLGLGPDIPVDPSNLPPPTPPPPCLCLLRAGVLGYTTPYFYVVLGIELRLVSNRVGTSA